MSRSRVIKIAKWTGIGLGSLLVILGGWLAFAWFSAGSKFEGTLEDLVPKSAIAMVRIDQPAKTLTDLDAAIERLAVKRSSFRTLESSPLWKSLFDGNPRSSEQLLLELRNGLKQAEASVAQIPVLGLELKADFLASEAVVAMLPKRGNGDRPWLALTRVSKSVDFGMGFSGWATGTQGTTTISELNGILSISQPKQPAVHVGLVGDVLVASSDRSVVSGATSGTARGGSFTALDGYSKSHAELQRLGGKSSIKAYASLDAIREEQGKDPKDPEGRSPIDTYFAISPEFARLSPEIMPSISTVLKRTVDTRVFDMAAWAVRFEGEDSVAIDQVLSGDDTKLDGEYAHLKPTWTFPAAGMDFLSVLPSDTWAVATNRLPFSPLREAIKPGLNPDGTPKKDAVVTFLEMLGKNPPVDSVGIALLSRRLSPDPVRHADRKPPRAVSPVALPGFAMFMHWPGVTTADAESLMRRQLQAMGASNLYAITKSLPTGEKFVAFEMAQDQELLRWMMDFACFAVNDHLLFVYSPRHVAVGEIIAASKEKSKALSGGKDLPWTSGALTADHSALVFVSPVGLDEYSTAVRLPPTLAEQRYTANTPYGKELSALRKEIAEKMTRERGRTIDWLHDDVEQEMLRMQREWVAMAKPYEAEIAGNLSAMGGAVRDFTAHTITTGAQMHTRFIVRLK